MPRTKGTKQPENVFERRGFDMKLGFNVPDVTLGKIRPDQRRLIYKSVRCLETIMKYAFYFLRGFEYDVGIRWDGPNPVLIIKIVLQEVPYEPTPERVPERVPEKGGRK